MKKKMSPGQLAAVFVAIVVWVVFALERVKASRPPVECKKFVHKEGDLVAYQSKVRARGAA